MVDAILLRSMVGYSINIVQSPEIAELFCEK